MLSIPIIGFSVDYLSIPVNDIINGSHQLSADGLRFEKITTVSSASPPYAEILYSDFQTSLIATAEIDSGWLDLQLVDKVQIGGKASASGMTLILESRAHPNQPVVTTTSPHPVGNFLLANITARQRYLRYRWINTTGSTVTDASLEIKASYGSADKLSVLPLSIDPSIFSQAGLVQSISKGQTPSGTFVTQGVNQAGASLVAGFGTEVARGLYSGYKIKNHFGHNADIDTATTPEDIIHGGGVYTGFNATVNENLQALSASASDSGALVSSGTATGGSATTLIDTGATFVTDTVAVGDIILNDTMGYHGFVTSIDSEIQLTVFRMNDGAGFTHINSTGDAYRVVESTSTGAAVIKLEGILSSSLIEQTDVYIIMNGTTAVTATASAFRCSRVRVVHSGSGDVNAGEITIRQATTTANIFALMDTNGKTEMALDTVPTGKVAVVKNIRASVVRTTGAAGSGQIIFFSRERGGSWNANEVFGIQTGANVDQKFVGGVVLMAGTDFKLTVQDVSDNNTEADGSLEYFFIDEEAL